ncbi:SRPBCC family protein [Xenorhabdus sp. SGI240]|uniref:SRPBCC family protein n=1 Tax=Xenorhabdus sp. SGI240 TaxID=3158262 RepID=UPI0032B79FCD
MLNEKNIRRSENDVAVILFELGITNSPKEIIDSRKDIRDELGLDSQEIITLVETISSLAISDKPLKEDNVNTVSDLINYLAANRNTWLHKDVPFILQGSTIINQNIDTVFSYISNYKNWPNILNHVSRIEPESDDGCMQSFIMHIEEFGTGQEYFVKSWRYINEEFYIIDFSQPIPPQGFKCHKGGWRFQALDDGRTRLISYHGFSLLDDTNVEDAIILIRKHIKAALTTWSRYGNGEKNV